MVTRAGLSSPSEARGPARPKVYAAHPMTYYRTEHAREHLALLKRLLRGVEIIDPEKSGWKSDDAWLSEWPVILAGMAGLVVFAAPDKTIGAGCVAETCDALYVGVPVAALDRSGLHNLDGLRFCPESRRSPRSVARLIVGDRIDPRRFVRSGSDGGKISS